MPVFSLTDSPARLAFATLFTLSLAASLGACDLDDGDGDGQACTEIACGQNGLRIEIRQGDQDLPAGVYDVALAADGIAFEGTCDTSESECEIARTDGVAMEDSAVIVWSARSELGFDLDLIVVDGSDLLGPDHVEIEVGFDTDSAVGEFDPVYDSAEPNGPGCGICEFATETVDLDV